jgi:hypothetical protein
MMDKQELQKTLEAIGKGGINVAGDLVIEKHVDYEVNNVEAGGIGIQVNSGREKSLTTSDEDIKEAIEALMEATDGEGQYIMHDLDQWYAIFRVLSQLCGYSSKPKDFETNMRNIGADKLRIPCTYDNYRKIVLSQLPANVTLWGQYKNSADQYSMKQIKVAVKLMQLLHLA